MKTLTIELPEELFARLNDLPREERSLFVAAALSGDLSPNLSEAIADALYAAELEANFDPITDAEECRLGIEEGLADIEAGRDISIEELMERYGITLADLAGIPEGTVSGQMK